MLDIIEKIPANILYAVILILFSLISALFGFLGKQIKNTKVAKIFLKVEGLIKDFCTQAELMKNYTAEEKENYVVIKTKEYLIQNNITCISEDWIRTVIKGLITFTKQVNYKEGN